MRFALVDNKLVQAAPDLHGWCPGCACPMVPKCGSKRVYHWAHFNKKMCDSWWEPETEWHRSWKNNFPAEWQEIFLPDKLTGEKHIADVRTSQDLVIEFQHSHLDAQERAARESFYQNMLWVVDGTRLKRDFPRFLEGKKHFRSVSQGIVCTRYPEECFPSAWIGSSVPVIFDFRGDETIANLNDIRNNVYWLFPKRYAADAIVAVWKREVFINAVINGELISWARNCIASISKVDEQYKNQIAELERLQASINFQRFSKSVRYSRNRRRF